MLRTRVSNENATGIGSWSLCIKRWFDYAVRILCWCVVALGFLACCIVRLVYWETAGCSSLYPTDCRIIGWPALRVGVASRVHQSSPGFVYYHWITYIVPQNWRAKCFTPLYTCCLYKHSCGHVTVMYCGVLELNLVVWLCILSVCVLNERYDYVTFAMLCCVKCFRLMCNWWLISWLVSIGYNV